MQAAAGARGKNNFAGAARPQGKPRGLGATMMASSPAEPTVVLVVGGQDNERVEICQSLAQAGYQPLAVASAAEARAVLAEQSFPAAVVEIFLSDGNGLSLIEDIRGRDLQAVVIVTTGLASLDTALAALRLGAYEYLCKPFTCEQLLQALRRGLEKREVILSNLRLATELSALAQQLQAHRASLQGEVGHAETSLAVFRALPEKLSAAHEPTVALRVLCETAARLSGADLAAVLAQRPGYFQVAAAWGTGIGVVEGCVLPPSPLLAAAMAEGRPALASDLLFGTPTMDDGLAALGLAGAVALCIPGLHGSLGCLLCAHQQPGGFQGETVSLLALVAAQAAVPLSRWLEEREEPAPAERFIEIDRLL